MKKLIFLSLLLSACAKAPEDPRTISGIAPELKPYVNLYLQVKGKGMSYDIPVQFANLSGNTVGVCSVWTSGYRQITIDKSYWNDPWTTEDLKISLIFHELGHCDLNRDHDESLRSDGWPASFMYPYNVGYMYQDEQYYFDELFHYHESNVIQHNSSCIEHMD